MVIRAGPRVRTGCSGAAPRSTGPGRQVAPAPSRRAVAIRRSKPGTAGRAEAIRRSKPGAGGTTTCLWFCSTDETKRSGTESHRECDPLSLSVSCYVVAACPPAAGSLSVKLCPVDPRGARLEGSEEEPSAGNPAAHGSCSNPRCGRGGLGRRRTPRPPGRLQALGFLRPSGPEKALQDFFDLGGGGPGKGGVDSSSSSPGGDHGNFVPPGGEGTACECPVCPVLPWPLPRPLAACPWGTSSVTSLGRNFFSGKMRGVIVPTSRDCYLRIKELI